MVADRAAGPRLVYLDNLKWVLIAGIIAYHAAVAYGAIGTFGFYYELTLGSFAQAVFSALGMVGMLFALEAFMLVAGLLTPRALAHKGTGTFLRDRILRLGLPFAVTVVVLTPAVAWLTAVVTRYPTTFPEILQWQMQHLYSMQMWFVAVLLVFSVCCAVWRWIRPATKSDGRRLELRHLLLAAALISALSFMVWLVFPLGSTPILDPHLWEWPQLAVCFAFGVLAGERGWLTERPTALIRRACWVAPLPALATFGWVFAAYRSSQPPYFSFAGGWHWQSAVLAVAWGMVAVGFSLALIDFFRRFGTWSGSLFRALGRDSYAAFFLQFPVLTVLELGLMRLAWPGEVKLAVVAPAGIVICFALAWAVRRTVAIEKGRRRWGTARPQVGC